MADLKTLVEREMDRAGEPGFAFEDLDGLRVRRHRTRRVTAAVVGLGLVLILSLVGARIYLSAPADRPGDRPTPTPTEEPSMDLGIFEPVAGRIVYYTNSSLWAVDPSAPSPSTLVRLGLEGTPDADSRFASFTVPLGWSSDGTELLFMREDPTDETFPYTRHLFILHADGTETQVTPEPVGGAAISPDGSRVVFAADDGGLYVVDAEGGQPVRIADVGESPTFSPDGTRIAYLSESGLAGIEHVWVANADGTDAHEILTDEALAMGMSGLTWSPAGDRIAIENQQGGHVAIYTFAPDGSDFTKVITGGFGAHWSPDGSRIAYMLPYGEPLAAGRPLAIADADGSNVRVFDFGGVGPWHPGATAAPEGGDVPAAALADDEVLWLDSPSGDDLLAVDAVTGESRVLVEDIPNFRGATRSADGRWVAYERWSGTSPSLWVVGAELEPRKVLDLPDESFLGAWAWSSTGSRLAADYRSRLHLIDPATGLVTDLASMASVDSLPAWSPDGTKIVLGVTRGTIDVVDVRTGERSLLAQLPGDDLASTRAITWSPDGSRLAVYSDVEPGSGRLFVMDANGSNIRVLAEGEFFPGFDWSPDGSRITFAEDYVTHSRIWIAPADGSTAFIVQSTSFGLANSDSTWGLPAWSPDGSQVAFSGEPNHAFVIDADGSGEPEPIDDLTYASWNGGSFCWSCLYWINEPVTYSGPGES